MSLAAIICCLTALAYTERNIITSKVDKESLGKALVQNRKWVPYPSYTDRAVGEIIRSYQIMVYRPR